MQTGGPLDDRLQLVGDRQRAVGGGRRQLLQLAGGGVFLEDVAAAPVVVGLFRMDDVLVEVGGALVAGAAGRSR